MGLTIRHMVILSKINAANLIIIIPPEVAKIIEDRIANKEPLGRHNKGNLIRECGFISMVS